MPEIYPALLVTQQAILDEEVLRSFAPPEQVKALELKLGLNDPIWQQYLRWAGGFLTGLGFQGAGWLWPLTVPPLAALVAFIATRVAAGRVLREQS